MALKLSAITIVATISIANEYDSFDRKLFSLVKTNIYQSLSCTDLALIISQTPQQLAELLYQTYPHRWHDFVSHHSIKFTFSAPLSSVTIPPRSANFFRVLSPASKIVLVARAPTSAPTSITNSCKSAGSSRTNPD